ncbi:hypothetical protein GFS31_02490 [Leptolyngbya sp. BL0902]|uniref:TRAFAC clade GTPase domain-containing protein n=1 Tax=Leptolyngbya sp. BL0902 TaxID=1115757 RepID=UPI0018E6F491|nr:hypothetical protein [Leptolyngbya sp. BL0902]QQE63582.1 hypothetical protein GFS31_02490 [Leptolyngbya sp. BL0902]
MNELQELNIIVIGPRGVGKTSFLAAMHEEFETTFWNAGLNTWTTDTQTLDTIEDCKKVLKNIDYRLQKYVDPTPPKLNPWEDKGLVFEIGSLGKKFMRVRFTDPAGEYFNRAVDNKYKDYVRGQLNQCDAVIIPVDATALMEKKTGKVNPSEIGNWHNEKNDPEHITRLFKESYIKLSRPRLVIFAPIKCEAYVKNDKDAQDLLDHVRLGYRDLIDFFKEDERYEKIAVVITPIQTIGHIAFSHAEKDEVGFTKFIYYKTPLDAPYKPKDADQPLRYVFRFLLNVFNEGRKLELEKAKLELDRLEHESGERAKELEKAKERLYLAEKRLKDRQQRWAPIKFIANFFDDVETPHDEAQDEVSVQEGVLSMIEEEKSTVVGQVNATEEQIQAFNDAILKFAIGCKQDHGFAILQGRSKWLPGPRSY